jgi:hypothetical protein
MKGNFFKVGFVFQTWKAERRRALKLNVQEKNNGIMGILARYFVIIFVMVAILLSEKLTNVEWTI